MKNEGTKPHSYPHGIRPLMLEDAHYDSERLRVRASHLGQCGLRVRRSAVQCNMQRLGPSSSGGEDAEARRHPSAPRVGPRTHSFTRTPNTWERYSFLCATSPPASCIVDRRPLGLPAPPTPTGHSRSVRAEGALPRTELVPAAPEASGGLETPPTALH